MDSNTEVTKTNLVHTTQVCPGPFDRAMAEPYHKSLSQNSTQVLTLPFWMATGIGDFALFPQQSDNLQWIDPGTFNR